MSHGLLKYHALTEAEGKLKSARETLAVVFERQTKEALAGALEDVVEALKWISALRDGASEESGA